MHRCGTWAVIAIVILGSCRPKPHEPPPAAGQPVPPSSTMLPPSSLVGVWRVVRFCDDDDSTGRLSDPWGASPIGYFIYAPSGQLSIQVMRTPALAPFARGDQQPTEAERRALFDAYFGYFGTYSIESDSVVIHHVSGGTAPGYVGTEQRRLYRVRGDSLTIGGSRRTWPCRLLLREPSGAPSPDRR